jgi:hypothetical protein
MYGGYSLPSGQKTSRHKGFADENPSCKVPGPPF